MFIPDHAKVFNRGLALKVCIEMTGEASEDKPKSFVHAGKLDN